MNKFGRNCDSLNTVVMVLNYLLGASMTGDCPTPGCTGIGHVKGAKYTGHHR